MGLNREFPGEKKINKPFFDDKLLIYNKLQSGFSPEIVSFKPGMHQEKLKKYGLNRIAIVASLQKEDKKVYERIYFSVPLKQLELPKPVMHTELKEINKVDGRFTYELCLLVKSMTVGINIKSARTKNDTLELSDNCFDMLPNTKRKVTLTSSRELSISDLVVESYNHIIHDCPIKKFSPENSFKKSKEMELVYDK